MGDLDGDGEYEMSSTGGAEDETSAGGMTDPPILEAYELDGTPVAINLGRNIREGAHYTQFMVYDLDGDGKAEVACKTADGTVDGRAPIGDKAADWVDHGYILRARSSSPSSMAGPAARSSRPITSRREARRVGSDRRQWGDDTVTAWIDSWPASPTSTASGPASSWAEDTTPGRCWWPGIGGTESSPGAGPSTAGRAPEGRDANGEYAAREPQPERGRCRWRRRDEIVYRLLAVDDNGPGLYTTGLGHGDAMHSRDSTRTAPA